MRKLFLPAAVGVLFLFGVVAIARAQDAPAGGGGPRAIDPARLPPQVKLGLRAEIVRRRAPVASVLVLTEDSAGYAAEIGRWTPRMRWPVLIDDGSAAARENIARFVRAFEPKQIVRREGAAALPEGADERRAAIERSALGAWGSASREQAREIWKALEFTPPGVVVCSLKDPAWTAGLALATARGQEFIWTESAPGPPGGVLPTESLAVLEQALERGLGAQPYAWGGMGDDIEAVTLCLNIPSRLRGNNEELALTDRIGRHADGGRWGWCGMIFGDEAAAAYRAMSSIFVMPKRAWLFDGYKPEFAPPYRVQGAAELLTKAGIEVTSNAAPKSGVDDWRQRLRRGVSAGFVHVNSSGLAESFELNPGRGQGNDAPLLREPAIVHFIHSFSAQNIDGPSTIAGAFMQRGAYAYIGSVHEPFLGAFVPAEQLVTRLLAPAPLGVAARQEAGKPWKINVYADPLITLGPAAPAAAEIPDLTGYAPVEAEMKAALKEKRFAAGLRGLVLLGRDDDVTRIVKALLKDDPSSLTPEAAGEALVAAFREAEEALFLELFDRMDRAAGQDAVAVDLLWQLARRTLFDTRDETLVRLLRANPRRATLPEDGADLAPVLQRLYGVEAARSFLAELAEKARDEHQRGRIREVSTKY